MNLLRATVVVLALVTLASLPCVIAWLVVNADEMTERAESARRKLPRLRQHRPIEDIAAELRRLSTSLDRAGSVVRRESVIAMRDRALREAAAALGETEHLGDLDGLDLEIERVRVIGVLQRAGLRVDDTVRQDHP